MLSKETLTLIEDSIRAMLEPLGFDLIELKYIQTSGNIILRLLVDRIEGGINLGECSSLNKRIGLFLEEKNIISDSYTLEVSSPGIDRPMLEPRDFKRALDKKIHVFLKNEHKGKIEIEGKLIKLDNPGITIISDNSEEFIPFLQIDRAKQVIL